MIIAALVVGIVTGWGIYTEAVVYSQNSTILLNGYVYVRTSRSVPLNITFSSSKGVFTSPVSDTSGACACGGYYFMLNIPNRQSYSVTIYYNDRTGHAGVCKTTLAVNADSEKLWDTIGCP